MQIFLIKIRLIIFESPRMFEVALFQKLLTHLPILVYSNRYQNQKPYETPQDTPNPVLQSPTKVGFWLEKLNNSKSWVRVHASVLYLQMFFCWSKGKIHSTVMSLQITLLKKRTVSYWTERWIKSPTPRHWMRVSFQLDSHQFVLF